jgi:hypothetical protein
MKTPKKIWEVYIDGDPTISKDNEDVQEYEISVIKKSNKWGHKSCGYDSYSKLILFDSEGRNGGDSILTESELAFMKKVAQILCDGLNNS